MIATFAVDEVVEGTQTGREARTLVVSLSQLAVGAGEPALAEATVQVVRPGDPVRISNVLDAVLPSVVRDDPASTFPGVLGPASASAGGTIHRLGGVAVLPVCDWLAAGYVGPDELPDSLVDMSGPGADRSPFGATANVVAAVRAERRRARRRGRRRDPAFDAAGRARPRGDDARRRSPTRWHGSAGRRTR